MTRNERIQTEAARWVARRDDPDWSVEEQHRLDRWLAESMAHKAAYWRLEKGWREADRIRSIGIGPAFSPTLPRWRGTFAAHQAKWAIAASIALAVGGTALLLSPHEDRGTSVASSSFTTTKGGHKVIALADGSLVEMNTDTSLRAIPVGKGRQDVWLDRGEAFFDIVHRADRMFVVHAGGGTVTVLGTRFSIRRDEERITVAVLSGRVRIDGPRAAVASPTSIFVSQGDVAIADHGNPAAAQTPAGGVPALLVWREGLLSFDDTKIRDAVDEFNRYADKPMKVIDPALGEERIGGLFEARKGEAFIDLLRNAYGVQVQRTPSAILIGLPRVDNSVVN